jgi:hypothetical protein
MVGSIQFGQIVVDCEHATGLGGFYAELLDRPLADGAKEFFALDHPGRPGRQRVRHRHPPRPGQARQARTISAAWGRTTDSLRDPPDRSGRTSLVAPSRTRTSPRRGIALRA